MNRADWSLRFARPSDAKAMHAIEAAVGEKFAGDDGVGFASTPTTPVWRLQQHIRKG